MLPGRHLCRLALTLWGAVLLVACGPRTPSGTTDGNTADARPREPDAWLPGDALVCSDGASLCGFPLRCCDSGNECVDDRCLPACESGIRCGDDFETCCGDGTVCLGGACVAPGTDCMDSYDCEPGNFCEPTIGQCLPQPDPLTCELIPNFTDIEITAEWAYENDEIISIPVVANLDGEGGPEVVLNLTQQDGGGYPGGRITVLDGRTGAVVLAKVPHDPPNSYGSHGRSTIAVGDVSGDDLPDIIYAARADGETFRSLIVAMQLDGDVVWTSHAPGGAEYGIRVDNAAVTLANFDDDDRAEVVIGATLLDHDGTVLWDQGGNGNGGSYGSNDGYLGGISVVADLDGDDDNDIVTGRHAWRVTWNAGPPATATVTSLWTANIPDGYPAIADLDGDGRPEVIVAGAAEVHILNGRTGAAWCGVDPTEALCNDNPALRTRSIAIPGGTTNNRGGPPTIADFDGDGRPEVGIAGGYSYSLYDFYRPGEDITGITPVPQLGQTFARWSRVTQDLSSNATGSSVFDFQGDGAAEVIYADECYLRVYDGRTGTPRLEIANTTGTIHEYPLVVDVDADGNSEILVTANDTNANKDCGSGVPANQGLIVYGDVNDEWVPTRRVWTQHTYHVTNATSAGNVPLVEENNWDIGGLNNYRQNVQGEGVFNAPDLAVELSIDLDQCAAEQFRLRARITNLGALGVPAGVAVDFHEGTDGSGPIIASEVTGISLLPGQSTIVSVLVPVPVGRADYFVVVDGGAGAGAVAECDDKNNDDRVVDVICPVIE